MYKLFLIKQFDEKIKLKFYLHFSDNDKFIIVISNYVGNDNISVMTTLKQIVFDDESNAIY